MASPTAARPGLTVADGQFWREGRPHQVISGGIHYFRVRPRQWEDRLRRLAAMGLNTVETYVPWNFHERRRGEADFSGERDLPRFLTIAGDLGLDVLLRPGPYICAEWTFGGLPAWLMTEPGIALRTTDPAYLDAVDAWFDVLIPVVRPFLTTRGGPVVAVQVENEYGSYGDDAAYLEHVRDGLVSRGVDVLLFTSDGPGPDWLGCGTIPGVLATANFGSRVVESFAELRAVQPDGPDMCMEYWNGWFDHWGTEHHTRDPEDAAAVLAEMLDRGASVNLYMAHGGTNFGLWSGANLENGRLCPTVTSYDYDAAVGEAGELTEKFHAFRDVIARHTDRAIPQPPALAPRLSPQTVEVDDWIALAAVADGLPPGRRAAHPVPMEDLGMDGGIVHYRGEVHLPPDGRTLHLDGLADRATVLADGRLVGVLDRNDTVGGVLPGLPMTPREDGRATVLDLFVENQGRINFASGLGERKGLRGVRLAERWIHGWQSTPVPLDAGGFVAALPFPNAAATAPRSGAVAASRVPDAAGRAPEELVGPRFARAWVDVDEPADGFLALPGWTKGYVWLNGFLLGRYWEIGPQVTLYAPAPLWRAGRNEVVVLEMGAPGERIEVRDAPDLG